MKPRTRSPFAGKPETIELKGKNGKREGFRIYAKHLSPLRARIADGMTTLTTLGFLAAAFIRASALPPGSDGEIVALFAAPLAAWPLVKLIWRWGFCTTAVVEIRKDVLKINGLFGWKTYDRNLPHAFAVLEHDKESREREALDLKARKLAQKGKHKAFPKYFHDSRHVVFVYVGQRIDIADVYGLREARAFKTRLSACAAFMDGQRNPDQGPVFDAEEEWANALGEI